MTVNMNREINFIFLMNLSYDCIELLATLFIEIIASPQTYSANSMLYPIQTLWE